MNSVMEAFTVVIDATALSSVNRQKLVVIVQNQQTSDEDDGELSDFGVETYQSHSSDIVDVLTDLLNKVQSETSDTRHDEFSAAHNFAMLKQFLEDKLTQDTKVLKKAKTEFAAALAAEKTDLAEASKSLVSLKTSQAASQSTCSQVTRSQ